MLHHDEEEAEHREEEHGDRRGSRCERRVGEQSDVEQRVTPAQFDRAERDATSATPTTMHPITKGSDQPRAGASRMPKTRIATPPPITTAPSQSSGLGSDSFDVATVSVSTKISAAAPANAQKMACHDQKWSSRSGAEHSDDCSGSGGARPDANGLVALILRVRRGE